MRWILSLIVGFSVLVSAAAQTEVNQEFADLVADPSAINGKGIVQWFTSTARYVRIDPIHFASSVPETGWAMAVLPSERNDGMVFHLLFADGELVGGEVIQKNAANQTISSRRYDRNLASLLETYLVYRGDGTLRSVEQCYDQRCTIARFAAPATNDPESITSDDRSLYLVYDQAAKLAFERVERGEMVSEERYTYQEGRLIQTVRIAGSEEHHRFYTDGRVTREQWFTNGRPIRTVERVFDEQGRVVTLLSTVRRSTERSEFSYRADNSYTMQRHQDDQLVLTERFEPGVDGRQSVTLRQYLRDGRVVMEERLNGRVVVEQSYIDGAQAAEVGQF